jgi:hypothetical protein
MAVYQADRAVLLIKAETVYATDPTPAAANLVYAEDIKCDLQGQEFPSKSAMGVQGKLASEIVEGPAKFTFKTKIRPPKSVGTAATVNALLGAAGFVETTSTNKIYTLTRATEGDTASCTIYYYKGGRFYKVTGCCGSVKITGKAGEPGYYEWDFMGFWSADTVADVAIPSLIGHTTLLAEGFLKGADCVVLGAHTMAVETVAIDFGIKVAKRSSANALTGVLRYWVQDYETKASIDPEVLALATFNPWTVVTGKTLQTLTTRFYDSGGNYVKVEITQMAIAEFPKEDGEREGLMTDQLSLVARAADADTPYTVVITYVSPQ